jgi:lysozyme
MANRSRLPIRTLALSATALVGLALHEGFRDKAYDDGVGVQTIGFGRTGGVKPGDRTTVERELVLLNQDVDRRQKEMRACVGDVPLAQNEWDAYVSFAYNVGVRAFCGSSAVRYLKQAPPDYEKACANLLEWNRAGGRVLAGLVKRRQDEYALCMGMTP